MPYVMYIDPDVEQIENLFNAVYGLQSETDPETESCRMALERLMVKKLMDFPDEKGTFKAGRIILNPETGNVIKVISPRNWWENKTLYLQEPVKNPSRPGKPEKKATERTYPEIAKEVFNKDGWEPYRNPLIMLQVRDRMGQRALTMQNGIAFGKQLNGIIRAVSFQKAASSDNDKIPELTRVSIIDTCYDAVKKIYDQCIFGNVETDKTLTREFMMHEDIGGLMTLHYIPEKDLDELVRSLKKCNKDEMKKIYSFAVGNKRKSISFDVSVPVCKEDTSAYMLGDFIRKYSTLKSPSNPFPAGTAPALCTMIDEARQMVGHATESMNKECRRHVNQLHIDWIVKGKVSKAFMTRMLSDVNAGLLSCNEPYLKKLMLKNGMATDAPYDPDTLWYDVLMDIWDIRRTDNQEVIRTDMQVNEVITDVLRKYFTKPGTQKTGSGN